MSDSQELDVVQHFVAGTPVYDATGELVGTVSNYIAQEQVLVVDKGPFRTDNLYVLLNEVQRSDAHGIYLSTGNDNPSNAS